MRKKRSHNPSENITRGGSRADDGRGQLEGADEQQMIFEVVWNELRPDALRGGEEAWRNEVTRRVAMYAESGLSESHRITNAVLNSFGRAPV